MTLHRRDALKTALAAVVAGTAIATPHPDERLPRRDLLARGIIDPATWDAPRREASRYLLLVDPDRLGAFSATSLC